MRLAREGDERQVVDVSIDPPLAPEIVDQRPVRVVARATRRPFRHRRDVVMSGDRTGTNEHARR